MKRPEQASTALQRFDYDTIDSTNEQAKRLLDEGMIHDQACVVAREQTAGKGTRGRSWSSPLDAGLYLTWVDARPHPVSTLSISRFTLAAGVACAEALAAETGVHARLKPVNDLFFEGRKLGGILAETRLVGTTLESLIIGVGINVRAAEHPIEAEGAPPICLEEIIGPDGVATLARDGLIDRLARSLSTWCAVVENDETDVLRDAWEARKVAGAVYPADPPAHERGESPAGEG